MILVVLAFFQLGARLGLREIPKSPNYIDFRLFYPIVNLDNSDVSRTQSHYLGLDLNYQIQYTPHLAWVIDPSGWFLPIRIGDSKETLAYLSFQSGLSIRFFPYTYLDPRLQLIGGIGIMDAGGSTDADFLYPVGGNAQITIYRPKNRFSDPSISLSLTGSLAYFLNNELYPGPGRTTKTDPILSSIYLDLGLALTGTF